MKNKIISETIIKTTAILVSLMPVIAFAGDEDLNIDPPDVSISDVLLNIRNYFLGAVIIASVFMILWGAFQYTTSGGDEKKTSNAKKTIYYACIGLVIAMLSVAIVSLVRGAIGG